MEEAIAEDIVKILKVDKKDVIIVFFRRLLMVIGTALESVFSDGASMEYTD